MAARYWVGTDTSWNTSANWASTSGGSGGAGVPTSADDVTFDGNGTNDCTADVNVDIASLTIAAGYSGRMDFGNSGTHNISGDVTASGSGTLDTGAGTANLIVGGNWDGSSQGTVTGFGRVEFTGAGKTITNGSSTAFHTEDLVISGSVTITGKFRALTLTVESGGTFTLSTGDPDTVNTITVSGTLTINKTWSPSTVDVTVNAGGEINGTGQLNAQNGTITNNGTWSVDLRWLGTLTLATASTFSGDIHFWWNNDIEFPAGTTTFTGEFWCEGNFTKCIIDCATNNPTVVFQGNVKLQNNGVAITWNKGTNPVKFTATSGTQTYRDDDGNNLGDVEHNGSGGTLQLLTDMECDDFTGTAGTFDINGANTLTCNDNLDWSSGYLFADPAGGTFTVGGNFTANGNDLSGATATWYLTVTGTAVASGAGDVAYSDASGGTQITATGWTDSSNNSNWDFGGATGAFPFQLYYGGGLIA